MKKSFSKYVIAPFILSKLLTIALFFIAYGHNHWDQLEGIRDLNVLPFLKKIPFYDGVHFTNITTHNYHFHIQVDVLHYGSKDLAYAFLPLQIVLNKMIVWLGIDAISAGLIVTSTSLFLLFVAFYKLLPENKRFVIYFIAFSPIGVYLNTLYSESLFLCLSTWSYFHYSKKNYKTASILATLSALTRTAGLLLIFTYIIDFSIKIIQSDRKYRKEQLMTLFSCGFISLFLYMPYLLFLYHEKGDFLFFITVQKYWNKSPAFIVDVIVKDSLKVFQGFWNHTLIPGYFLHYLLNYGFLAIALLLCIQNFKRNFVLSLFLLLGSLYPLMTFVNDAFMGSKSLVRYILGLFPFYFMLQNTDIKLRNALIVMIFIVLDITVTIINFNMGFIA